jgi:hypothetical protein
MPTTYAIPNGAKFMDATTYTGNTATRIITNSTGFNPDLVWIKDRTNANWNVLFDSVRGANKQLSSNNTNAELTPTLYGYVSAFNSGSFTLAATAGDFTNVNQASDNYVAWQWQAGQGTTSSNTDGSITSTVSANVTAGFSIVTYTGTGAASATIGHGLGIAPSLIFLKKRNAVSPWYTYHSSVGASSILYLNATDAAGASSAWNSTSPTSTVFSVASSLNDANTFVAYCWAEVAGFSKFGSYTGNGSTDGVFVYTGFRPKYILIKRTNGVQNWCIQDTSRSTYNVASKGLFAQSSDAEADNSFNYVDILSNGFKLRTTDTGYNGSSDSYVYAAFAETPFKYSNAR